MAAVVGVGTLAKDTAEGRAKIAAAIARLRGGSRIVRTAEGRRGLIEFEIARLREWCLENEEPWQPRWYGEAGVGRANYGGALDFGDKHSV
jgi:hypothetical protein